MKRRLTVVLGAGASYDCRHKYDGTSNHAFRPPLAAGLFDSNPEIEEILGRYPGAERLSEEIRASQRSGDGLEDILLDLSTRKSRGARADYYEIALYLRDLLGSVSAEYIGSGSTKYTRLVRDLDEWSYENENEALFLTLNYDTLLEREIKGVHRIGINSMEDYIRKDRSWSLVKLHGSCDWGYRVSPTSQGFSNWSTWVKNNLDVLDEERDVEFLGGHGKGLTAGGKGLFYPALAVPLGSLKRHVCPESHSECARSFIAECEEFLVIGMSAKDKSVCELLGEAKHVNHVTIVNGKTTEDGVHVGITAFRRLSDHVEQFQSLDQADQLTIRKCGFTQFIDEGGLTDLLSS